jgi:transposase
MNSYRWFQFNCPAHRRRLRGRPIKTEADGVTLPGLLVKHRKFSELHVANVATQTVECNAEFWQVDETGRGQSVDARVAVGQQTSTPIFNDLFALWHATLSRVSGKSKLVEALRYAISRRAFERFPTDGHVELDGCGGVPPEHRVIARR